MRAVSEDYKTQIRYALRNPSYIKILFDVIDPQAAGDASVADNVHTYYSDVSNTIKNFTVATSYPTLEQNRFLLNGLYQLAQPPAVTSHPYQGHIGSEISGSSGMYETPNTITVEFLTNHFSLMGLSFDFDTHSSNYPKQLQIQAFDGTVSVYDKVHNVDRAENWVCEDPIPVCNKIVLTALQSDTPYRRFRVQNILFGIRKIFTSDNIISATWNRTVDLISSKLPTNSFDFTILDVTREYDPENPSGVFNYLEDQQPCTFYYGYELDNGTVEWMLGGNTYTSGEVAVDTEATIPKATFKTVSIVNHLKHIYNEGRYYPAGRSLYDLAEDVLRFCNLPLTPEGNVPWIIDESLKDVYTKMALPVEEARVCLQLVANAGCCILCDDPQGNVVISQSSEITHDFAYSFSDVLTPPKTKKYPVLRAVDTSLVQPSPATTLERLGEYDVVAPSVQTIELSHDLAIDITATASGGLSILGTPEYFGYMTRLTASGTGKIILQGYPVEVKGIRVSKEVGVRGDRCEVTNMLITDSAQAITFAEWVAGYLNKRNMYEIQNRGFPEVDAGDQVYLDTLFTQLLEVHVLSNTIEYNGALKGKTTLLIKEEG